MKKIYLLLFITCSFVLIAKNAKASFYDDFLAGAIAKCPGFIGGSSQMTIATPFSRWTTGQHRFESTCIIPFRENRDENSTSSKEGNKDDTPSNDTKPTEDDDKCVAGSVIRPNTATVGDFLPVSGAPFSLMYSTDRVKGRVGQYQVEIPVHDSNSNVESYNVYANYAGGRIINLNFENDSSTLENKKFIFQWDGRDVNGDVVLGSIEFNFTVTLTAHGKEIPITYQTNVGSFDAETVGLGLWTPSIYHFYDIVGNRLYRGDGTSERMIARAISGGDLMIAAKDESEFYIFDDEGRHKSTLYGLTGAAKYTFTYNGNDELTSITGPYSQTTTFTRTNGLVTQITAPKGQVTTITYDSRGYLQTISNEMNEKFEVDYYDGGLLKAFKKPGGQSSHFYYNEKGNLTKDFHSSGYFTEISMAVNAANTYEINTTTTPSGYESINYVDNIAQAYGAMNTITYNPLGFRTETRQEEYSTINIYPTYTETRSQNVSKRFSESAKAGGSSKMTVNGKGVPSYLTQTVDFNDPSDPFDFNTMTFQSKIKDKVSTSVYNSTNKTWTSTSAEGRQSVRTINNNEQTTSVQIGTYLPTVMSYAADGRLSKITQGKRTTQFSYDENGYVNRIVNPLRQETHFENDEEGRVTRQITADGRNIEFEYDKNGKQTTITPPGRPSHSFLYNAFEGIQAYIPPELSGFQPETTYLYNKDKQLVKVTRPDGQTIEYSYNSTSGLLTQIIAPEGEYNISYDEDVNRISAGNALGDVSVGYYYYGPYIQSEIQYYDGSTVTWSKKFDDEHRVISVNHSTVSDSSEIRLVYDRDDLLVRNGDLKLSRDNSQGLVTSAQIGNAKVDYIFDPNFGELSAIKYSFNGQEMDSISYQRDPLGRIHQETRNGHSRFFIYDEAGRLIGSRKKDETQLETSFEYDSNGNRTVSKSYNTATNATYDSQDRLLTWGSYTFTYNENGDLESKTNTATSQTTSYSYDVFGNLKSVTLPDSTVIQYKWDFNNRRMVKTISSILVYRFMYEDQLRISAEIDENNNIVKQFLYGDSPNVPEAMIYNGNKYLFLKDSRGSVLMVVNSSTGAIAQEITYNDWGQVLNDSNPGFQPFGFAGGLYDHQTGLVRFGARDYDPIVGRWTTKDPIMFEGGDTNLYSYSMQDPINFTDFNGLFADDLIDYISDQLVCFLPKRTRSGVMTTAELLVKGKMDQIHLNNELIKEALGRLEAINKLACKTGREKEIEGIFKRLRTRNEMNKKLVREIEAIANKCL